MISFTFSVDQVKSAPPEVRQWIEHQVAAALVSATTARSEPPQGHAAELASCTIEEAAVVLGLIRDDIATTHVFLELARETPAGNNVPPLRALNIADILRHTRLNGDRLVDCLSVITQTFQQIHGAPEAALFGLDQSHLYLHEGTHRSIRGLWQQLVQVHAPSRTTDTAPTASARAPLTGSVPPPGAAADPRIATSRQAPPLYPDVAESSAPAPTGLLKRERRLGTRRPLPSRRQPRLRYRPPLRWGGPRSTSPHRRGRRRRFPPHRRGRKRPQPNRRRPAPAGQIGDARQDIAPPHPRYPAQQLPAPDWGSGLPVQPQAINRSLVSYGIVVLCLLGAVIAHNLTGLAAATAFGIARQVGG